MKHILNKMIASAGLVAISFSLIISSGWAAQVGLMSKEQLKESLGDGSTIILDVRTGRDWHSSEFKIKGAVRAAPKDFETWAATLDKTKKIVLYCA